MALIDGLISHWRLNENAGEAAIDAHGSNTLDLVTAVGAAAGKIDGARSFSPGSGSQLAILDNAGLSVANQDFTKALWARLVDKADNYHLAGKYDNTVENSEFTVIYLQPADRFRFVVYDGAGNQGAINANNLGSPAVDTWYLIIVWHDAASDTVNIQVNNGTPSSAAYANGSHDGSIPFALGESPDLGNGSLAAPNGLIDSVSFWKRVLTSEERAALWNDGAGLDYPFSTGGGGTGGAGSRFDDWL